MNYFLFYLLFNVVFLECRFIWLYGFFVKKLNVRNEMLEIDG